MRRYVIVGVVRLIRPHPLLHPLPGPEKVLVVNSSRTVIEVKQSAKDVTISNMEIKVWSHSKQHAPF